VEGGRANWISGAEEGRRGKNELHGVQSRTQKSPNLDHLLGDLRVRGGERFCRPRDVFWENFRQCLRTDGIKNTKTRGGSVSTWSKKEKSSWKPIPAAKKKREAEKERTLKI